MQVQHAPRSDRARRRSRAQGDRLVSPRRAETRRKAAPARASAAPSSLASAANRVRATESPFAKAINGLLQQNRHFSDLRRCPIESPQSGPKQTLIRSADARGCDGSVRQELAEAGMKSAYMVKSLIRKQTIVFRGKKTTVSCENAFWNALKEIASKRVIRLSDLVAEIDERRRHDNLSSAVRLFVLDYYQRLRKNAE